MLAALCPLIAALPEGARVEALIHAAITVIVDPVADLR